jgi:ribonucleoside-diphosphate reductase subunit M2
MSDTYIDLPSSANRISLFPIKYPIIWALYKQHESLGWRADDLSLSSDKEDFKTLSSDEQEFIKYILAFFVVGDLEVGNLLIARLNNISLHEIQSFYKFQQHIENVHFEVYSLMVDGLVLQEEERKRLYEAVSLNSAFKTKVEWIQEYIKNDSITLGEIVVFLAIIEGIFFSGAFAAMFWLKKIVKMPGLTHANELISRDEFLHCQFACEVLKNHIFNKPSNEKIKQMIEKAVEIETAFYEHGLPVRLKKMNKESMIAYTQVVADRLYQNLTGDRLYEIDNPFEDTMSSSAYYGKTNFFERNVSEYGKMNVESNFNEDDSDF